MAITPEGSSPRNTLVTARRLLLPLLLIEGCIATPLPAGVTDSSILEVIDQRSSEDLAMPSEWDAGASEDLGTLVEWDAGSAADGTPSDGNSQPPAQCMDGIENGAETGVDCGGPLCGKCGIGKGCKAPRDCSSGACREGQCVESVFHPVETYVVGFLPGGLIANDLGAAPL